MRIIIVPTMNGAYVEFDDGENQEKYSYTFNTENDNMEGAIALFDDLRSQLGLAGSRYDRQRLFFDIRHGDKFDCTGCEVCGKGDLL